MSDKMKWFLLEVNPEPWAIGDVSVGRKSGKLFPIVGRNAQLYNYQEAVKELLGDTPMLPPGKYKLEFYFWRQQAAYTSDKNRRVRKHEADATNLQKGLEDALQGILIANDRDVIDIHSTLVEQGPDVKPMVILGVQYIASDMSDAIFELPSAVYELLESMDDTQCQLELDLQDPTKHPAADDEVF